MNEIEFRIWMWDKNINKKVQGDCISRLKKIEREITGCDIDEQYYKDKCKYLLSLFQKRGVNDHMKQYSEIALPIGKSDMNTFCYAIRLYIKFCDYNNNTI